MFRPIIALLLLLAAAPAMADEEKTYEGVAGSSPIVMGLTEGRSDVSGQYFYRSSRLDIDLAGEWRGSSLELTSRLTGDRLNLARAGGGFAGALTTAKGRRFTVTLRPVSVASSLPADLPPGLSLYARLQLAGLSLTPQGVEIRNGKTIRWYRNPLTGIRLFRLESGYPAPAMAAMNRALTQAQWSEVLAWLQCPGSDGRSGVELSEAEEPWLGTDYVSYRWRSGWSCAGTAHPDFGVEGHSFDARTGRKLKLDEVLPMGGRSIPPENSDAWYSYRSNTFAPAVVALLTRHHKAEMTKPPREDDCGYAAADVWSFPAWVLTKDGLWLGATFPRVMRACDTPDWSTIPWAALPSQGAAARR
jgi:hypothetical protein